MNLTLEQLHALQAEGKRWRFLSEHWHSLMGGIPLHRWLDEQSLRLGGLTAALDHAIEHHESGERHIQESKGLLP
jgi:hypothetical protein